MSIHVWWPKISKASRDWLVANNGDAVREDIMSRQSLISTMISGWRMFKD